MPPDKQPDAGTAADPLISYRTPAHRYARSSPGASGVITAHTAEQHDAGQVTIWATITDTTPGIIAALTADPRTDSDTAASTSSPALFADLQAAATAPETADKSARPGAPGRRGG